MKEKWQFPLVLAVFTAVMAVVFWPVGQKLAVRWSTGDDNYCALVPFLFLYLCWDKRRQFRFESFSWNVWGLAFLLPPLALVVMGELGSLETLLYAGLWGTLVALGIILYGRRLRQLAFPFFILLFMIPLPPYVNQVLTFKLKILASALSGEALRMAGISVLREGNVLDLGVGKLQIVEACSGMRYLFPMILMALLLAHFFLKNKWLKIAVVLFSVPLSLAVNVVRVVVTGVLMDRGHHEMAQGFYHDFSGWLLFMMASAVLALMVLLFRSRGKGAGEASEPALGAAGPPVARRVSLVASTCLVLLLAGWVLRVIPDQFHTPSRKSFSEFPMVMDLWKGERQFLTADIEDNLAADDYVIAVFRSNEHANVIHLMIPYYSYQTTRHAAHAPLSCLLGSGWNLVVTSDRSVSANPYGELGIREMLMQRQSARVLSSYFFLQRGRILTDPWWNKFYLVWDAVTRKRTDGALVRLEIPLLPGQEMEEARAILDGFIARLCQILPPFVPS